MSSDKRSPRSSAPTTLVRSSLGLDDDSGEIGTVDDRLGGEPGAERPRTDRHLARQRMWRRRRRAILLAVLLMLFSVAAVKAVRAATGSDGSRNAEYLSNQAAGSPSEAAASSRSPSASPSPSPTPTVVDEGNGEWTYADEPAEAEKYGDKGTLMAYNVAVEGGVHADAQEFAAHVAETLADERGWTAGHDWRFKPVGKRGDADFTVYLASPKTRAKLCGAHDTYTSCRNGDKVVINLERWLLAVPHWTSSLDTYRQYVVNHEVGHRLGQGHVTCPKKGKPSPVMAQQTIELRGCDPNAWPFPEGKYITGPPGEYL